MMMDTILWLGMAFLACVGFVQCAAWIAVRFARKGNRIYRVIPVGGEGKHTGDQMALMYTCLQWEANPSQQVYVLYGTGLGPAESEACEELARGTGVFYVTSPEELAHLLQLP